MVLIYYALTVTNCVCYLQLPVRFKREKESNRRERFLHIIRRIQIRSRMCQVTLTL